MRRSGSRSVADFIAWYAREVRLPATSMLSVDFDRPSITAGYRNLRVRHIHNGVVVRGDELRLGVKDDRVTSAFARVVPDLNLETRVSSTNAAAGSAASSAVINDHRTRGLTTAVSATTCELVFRRPTPALRPILSWLCNVDATYRSERWSVAVDPANLRPTILGPTSFEARHFVEATGDSYYLGAPVSFTAMFDDAINTHLLRSPAVVTLDNQNSWDAAHLIQVGSATSHFSDPDDLPAVSAHWAAQSALATIQARLGIDTFAAMVSATGRPNFENQSRFDFANGSFNPERARMRFGFIGEIDLAYVDFVSHEYGHAATIYPMPPTSGAYVGEYGALLESLADIIGETVERDALGVTDWIMLGRAPAGLPKRVFEDPSSSSPVQPSIYGAADPAWHTTTSTIDRGGVHTNCSIASLWYWLMANGGAGTNSAMTNYSVDGAGDQAALEIAYKTIAEKIPYQGTFPGAREASVIAAVELCGEFSRERRAAHNAWHAVGLYASGMVADEYHLPANGATNVAPWPARLVWQASANYLEDAWEVQISRSDTFPPAETSTHAASGVTGESGYFVGSLEVDLEPSKTYYWRVRRALHDADLECWRPTRSFTTSDNAPVIYHPQGVEFHPWLLEFAFSGVPGATHYDVEVYEYDAQQELQLMFPAVRINADHSDLDQHARFTVKKLQEQVTWKVRAVRQRFMESELQGEWSEPAHFSTREPEVVLHLPVHGDLLYPWTMGFFWYPLLGAEFMLRTRGLNQMPDYGPNGFRHFENWFGFNPDVSMQWTSEQPGYEWWVQARGPGLGYELEPLGEETREDAKASAKREVYLDNDPTRPNLAKSPNVDCVDGGTEVTASWPPVAGASRYALDGSLTGDTTDTSASFFATPAPGESGVGIFATAFAPNYHPLPAGEVEGVGRGEALWAVRPSKPSLVSIHPSPLNLQDIEYEWTSTFPGNYAWHIQVFEGSGCSGDRVIDGVYTVPPNTAGGSSFRGTHYGLDPVTYSMRIKHRDVTDCPDSEWSDCVNFGGPEPPPDPAIPAVNCGDTIHWGGNAAYLYRINLSSSPVSGQARLNYDHLCVPDLTAVRTSLGATIIQTGCASTGTWDTSGLADYDGSFEIDNGCAHQVQSSSWEPFNNATYLLLEVVPNCLGLTNTAWHVQVECSFSGP